jgi:hypothetical protein
MFGRNISGGAGASGDISFTTLVDGATVLIISGINGAVVSVEIFDVSGGTAYSVFLDSDDTLLYEAAAGAYTARLTILESDGISYAGMMVLTPGGLVPI